MLLVIDDHKTIGELQDKFNECFPYLKIEFYDARHRWQQASLEEHILSGDRKLGDIRRNHNCEVFEIRSGYKTGRVEQDLRNFFGLYVQIFFTRNNEWVQSVAADDLTLADLNEQANDLPKEHST